MRNKSNCWEAMKCGRETGGDKADELGVCPVSSFISADNINGGVNGGRICWIIDENGCNNGLIHRKEFCFQCEFRYKVLAEEGLLNVCRNTGSFLEIYGHMKDH